MVEGVRWVGPVLNAGVTADAIVEAICELNPEARVDRRRSFVRVEVANHCVVTRAAIEGHLGRAFSLPSDLEAVMPSFKGKLWITEGEVRWSPGS